MDFRHMKRGAGYGGGISFGGGREQTTGRMETSSVTTTGGVWRRWEKTRVDVDAAS